MTESKFGTRVGTLKATPIKRALRNDAKKLHVDDAIGEIVDNAVDNFSKQQALGKDNGNLLIEILMDRDEVMIRENSGGVSPEDLQAFVQLGASGQVSPDSPHIGVWGQGQKLALAALGYDDTISTRYWNAKNMYEIADGEHRTDQVVLRMSEEWWLDDDDWDVPVYIPEDELEPGVTIYSIRKVNTEIDDEAVQTTRAALTDLYGAFLAETDAVIRLNGEELPAISMLAEENLRREFAYYPGMEPSRHLFEMEAKNPVVLGGRKTEETRRLRMEAIVGLVPRQQVDSAGVYMFGVPSTESGGRLGPRKFVKEPVQDESVGFTTGPNSTMRKGHPSIGRLRIYVVFTGESEDIPWGMPGSAVKRGYNKMNPFADQIRENIKSIAAPYAKFASRAREIDMLPFSAVWETKDDDQRRAIVRKGARLLEDDLLEPEVNQKVRPLLDNKFEPKPFLEWDHRKSAQPPIDSPAFDVKKSKAMVSDIAQRDKRLRELEGLDPEAAVDELMSTLDSFLRGEDEGWDELDESRATKERMMSVSFRVPQRKLRLLMKAAGTDSKTDAVMAAVDEYLELHGQLESTGGE